jgi:hypothetical protein
VDNAAIARRVMALLCPAPTAAVMATLNPAQNTRASKDRLAGVSPINWHGSSRIKWYPAIDRDSTVSDSYQSTGRTPRAHGAAGYSGGRSVGLSWRTYPVGFLRGAMRVVSVIHFDLQTGRDRRLLV